LLLFLRPKPLTKKKTINSALFALFLALVAALYGITRHLMQIEPRQSLWPHNHRNLMSTIAFGCISSYIVFVICLWPEYGLLSLFFPLLFFLSSLQATELLYYRRKYL
jgi:hypothetical protein